MGRGHRRGPKQLRFRTLLDSIGQHVDLIPEIRQTDRIQYPLQDFYRSGFALFYLQDPSLLEFQKRFQEQVQSNNLNTVFGVESIPKDTQLRDVVDMHGYSALNGVFSEYFRRLQRAKQLNQYQFYEGRYLITLDGSEYFNSEKVQCELCLQRKKSSGTVEYYHQILQPALVHPQFSQVIPLAPEFIRVQDGSSKQDCETNAGKRAVQQIRSDHPQLSAIILGDSLYSTGPFVRYLQQLRFSFFLVAKPGDHKSLYQDIEGLRRGDLLDRLETENKKGQPCLFEWVNQVDLNGQSDSPTVNYMQLTIFDSQGQISYRNSWVTDILVTVDNVEHLVQGARTRWKIENEGFNTLKNQGYHLEHNFGHGKKNLSEAFFILNMLAFFMHQIFELVDRLYQQVRASFSARTEYWNAVRSSFRMFIFDSWDQVLQRMNSPPQPAFE